MGDKSLEEYRNYVQLTASVVESLTSEPDPVPLHNAVFDACDGYPVYHSQILDVLRYCDAEIGETPPERWESSADAWDTLHVIAADCYRRDVRAELRERGAV